MIVVVLLFNGIATIVDILGTLVLNVSACGVLTLYKDDSMRKDDHQDSRDPDYRDDDTQRSVAHARRRVC